MIENLNPSIKKVILLNNTINNYHHGCDLVITNLKKLLKKNNFEIILSVNNGKNWISINNFDDYIKKSDLIIINGEGTIHHNQKIGIDLLKISEYAKLRNTPCYLINATYENNDFLYQKYLKLFELIFVRDSFSNNELKKININSKICPDLTFYYKNDINNFKKSKNNKILITDSNCKEITLNLFDLYLSNKKKYKYSTILKSSIDLIDTNYINIKKIKYIVKQSIYNFCKIKPKDNDINRFYGLNNLKKFLLLINNSKYVISGRFHVICFCILLEIPFLSINSNSQKINSLINDIGLNNKRLINKEKINYIKINDNYIFEQIKFSKIEKLKITNFKIAAKKKIDSMFQSIYNSVNAK